LGFAFWKKKFFFQQRFQRIAAFLPELKNIDHGSKFITMSRFYQNREYLYYLNSQKWQRKSSGQSFRKNTLL